ncbi:sulfoquinovose isomerase [Bacillus kexueae]|uniref:sulfoquinovose isomerase n=1 Tax=Aeribacillus kexueae TaxID=2078952 RepID=UPI001FAF605F|nr:hypothetical protein [Bacillus kexueae]
MLEHRVLYVPIGRKTFDLQVGEEYRVKTIDWLKMNCSEVYAPSEIVTSIEDLELFLRDMKEVEVDAILYQSVTFADGEFIQTIINERSEHVVVWSVREPSVGGRLRLNSLTGGNSTCNVLKNHQHPFSFLFGNPDEPKLHQNLLKTLKVQSVIRDLNKLKIGVIGDHPPGFFFSDTKEEELESVFGVMTDQLDLKKAFKECVHLPESEWMPAVDIAEKYVHGINRNEETVQRFAQFFTYVQKYIDTNNIRALAIRCWPDFFNELGAAACTVLSQFTELKVPSSCESDIHGALSMYILQQLSEGEAPYLGDLVHVNETNNSVVFWHCGAGAYSLAHPKTGAKAGVHPNRKLGLTMEFGLKPGKVTIFRVGYTPQGYRMIIFDGEALDTKQPFNGTSVEVQLSKDVSDSLVKLMEEGVEPHFALVYDDVKEELELLAKRLQLPVVTI